MIGLRTMTRRIWYLALAAAAVRAAGALTVAVVAPDGARYLRMARLISEGRIGEGLCVWPYNPPLYPFLISFLNVFVPNDLFVAAAISVLLGGLAAIPLHYLMRTAWGEKVADLGVLVYAFLPSVAVLHGEVMLEGTFMFFFFGAMAIWWSALENKSWERSVLAGVGAAAAWLTRPEGFYLIPLFLFAAAIKRSRFAIGAVGMCLAATFVVAYPYLTFIKSHTGGWGISASPFARGVIGLLTGETPATGYAVTEESAREFSEVRAIARFGRVGGPIIYVLQITFKNYFYILAPFLFLGFAYLRKPEGGWGPRLYLLAAAAGYFIPPVLAFVAATPFSYRYVLVTHVLLLPVVALGLLQAGRWARHPKALPVFMAIVLIAMAVRDIRPKRTDKIGMKEAGLAILERLGPAKRILTVARQVEYYSRGEQVDLPPALSPDELDDVVRRERIDAVALHESDLKHAGKAAVKRLEEKYVLLGRFPADTGPKQSHTWVYLPPSP